MKNLILIILFQIGIFNAVFAQKTDGEKETKTAKESMKPYKGKTFIFDGNETISECSPTGVRSNNTITAFKGTLFTVEKVDTLTGDLTIKFLIWKYKKSDSVLSTANRSKYNFKSNAEKGLRSINTDNDNVKFFLLKKGQMEKSCSEYLKGQNLSLSIGTFTTPFKFRPSTSTWTSNLNLGTSLYIERRVIGDWAFGGVLGVALSSVTLDSASTNGLTKSTERPAITPSLSILGSYKNINLTLGVGWDFINRTSKVEKAWIYQGKHWIGFGIGVSLFKDSAAPKTEKTSEQ